MERCGIPGVYGQGCVCLGCLGRHPPNEMVIAAAGRHPTGMYYCFLHEDKLVHLEKVFLSDGSKCVTGKNFKVYRADSKNKKQHFCWI